jgi:hypothetical protein
MRKHRNSFKNPPFSETNRFKVDEGPVDSGNKKPIFSFLHMEYNSESCISRCNNIDKASVLSKLVELSQLTWSQIISSPKKGNGFEMIPISNFHVAMPGYVTEDVDRLLVFRYSRSGRIAGQRERDIFHILLVGQNLYPH